MSIEFNAGDEIVISRRRRFTMQNPETKEDEEKVELTEISAVSCPSKCKIGGSGGVIEPIYEADTNNEIKDRRFLMIKLPLRY